MSNEQDNKTGRRDFLKISGGAIAGAAIGVIGTKVADKNQKLAEMQNAEGTQSFSSIGGSINLSSQYQRLSSDIDNLKNEYKVVVIGSGYGASVMAARLAEHKDVLNIKDFEICILERGMERQPGEYPDKLELFGKPDSKNAFFDLRSEVFPLGMYEVHATGQNDIVVANGLGGTSNINANVVLEPREAIFTDEENSGRWPEDIKFETLKPHFDKVRKMLNVEKWDENNKDLGKLEKVEFMKACVERIKNEFQNDSPEVAKVKHEYLDLAVNLTKIKGDKNAQGVMQNLCTHCGDCITGCNVGAKNTLIMNYLPFAHDNGVQIFTKIEVERIEALKDKDEKIIGYNVHCRYYNQEHRKINKGNNYVTKVVKAKNVIVGAGTIGTFKILQKSVIKDNLNLSKMLGEHYSGNADVLGTCYNSSRVTNGIGFGTTSNPNLNMKTNSDPKLNRKVGPSIVSILDMRHDPNNQFLVEDGAFPSALTKILRASFPIAGEIEKIRHNITQDGQARNRAFADTFGELSVASGLNHSMCYLAMGRDSASGKLYLEGDKVRMNWNNKEKNLGEENAYKKAKQVFIKMSEITGGVNFENPRTLIPKFDFDSKKDGSIYQEGGIPVSVHALGGCCVADDSTKGVVNSSGQVFHNDGSDQRKVYPGLFVADGSVIPVAVEANPFLTIAAMAELFAERIIKDKLLNS